MERKTAKIVNRVNGFAPYPNPYPYGAEVEGVGTFALVGTPESPVGTYVVVEYLAEDQFATIVP